MPTPKRLPRFMHNIITMLFAVAIVLPMYSATSQAAQTVRVGVYPYIPFTAIDEQGQAHGMVPELITILNDMQQEFRFVATPVSPKRRYEFYKMNQLDAFFYESLLWGWSEMGILSSVPYQRSGERYIALAESGRDQTFFENLSDHHLIAVLGYHYGFADFNSDEDFLRKQFQITLTWDESNMLELLQQGKGDIAVINETYWSQLQQQQPDFTQQFLISDRYDQQYTQSILMRPSLMTQQQLDQLVKRMQSLPAYRQLQQRYGVSPDQ
ncbi:hypothetical protein [Bacterioplanoides sp.]|uniref:hypothetical protein n=1 Tax=Bacterioplanoides sp. TaxID=2066072 RepID=UPI003B00324D